MAGERVKLQNARAERAKPLFSFIKPTAVSWRCRSGRRRRPLVSSL